MTNEESFEKLWDRTYQENIEEKIKNGIPLSELEWEIYSTARNAKEALTAFVFAFLIVFLLLFCLLKLPF